MLLTSDYFELLGYLLILTFLIHFPFIGLIIGTSSLSLIFQIMSRHSSNERYSHLAKDLIALAGRKSLILIFGVIPIIITSLIFMQLYLPHAPLPSYVWLCILTMTFVSFVLLSLYHNGITSERASFLAHSGIGLAGVGFMLTAYFFFIHAISLTLYPEKWGFITHPLQITFSLNAFAKFGYFLALCFSWSGAALLLSPRFWNETKKRGKFEDNIFIKKLGLILSLSFTLILPILLIMNVATLPEIALSSQVYLFSLAALLPLFIVSLLLMLMLRKEARNFGFLISSLFLLSFLVWTFSEHGARAGALKEPIARTIVQAEEAQKERDLVQQRKAAALVAESEKSGEEIFNLRCTACHRFDEAVLGPPLQTVLPKYKNKIAELKSFIANPYKIDPSYPAMPRLGLTEKEIESIASYVLERLKEQSQ